MQGKCELSLSFPVASQVRPSPRRRAGAGGGRPPAGGGPVGRLLVWGLQHADRRSGDLPGLLRHRGGQRCRELQRWRWARRTPGFFNLKCSMRDGLRSCEIWTNNAPDSQFDTQQSLEQQTDFQRWSYTLAFPVPVVQVSTRSSFYLTSTTFKIWLLVIFICQIMHLFVFCFCFFWRCREEQWVGGQIQTEVPGISAGALPQRKWCPVCSHAEGKTATWKRK